MLLNSVVSVIQTKKAEGSLDALKSLSAPNANVIRDGKEQTVPAKELVVGDIVILEAGDYVPADGRLIEEGALKVDEGMLTGESTPAEKELGVIDRTAPIGDRDNMVFSGTIVTYGRGRFHCDCHRKCDRNRASRWFIRKHSGTQDAITTRAGSLQQKIELGDPRSFLDYFRVSKLLGGFF